MLPDPIKETSQSVSPSAPSNLSKPYKSKDTVIKYALFLGIFGIHRFYLRQYGIGLLYLLFFWTLIPLIIAIIDIVVFQMMSQEKFDSKYNTDTVVATASSSNSTKEAQSCTGCGTGLTFTSTPNFGGGKLNDGGRVCRECFRKIVNQDRSFGMYSHKNYDSDMVREIIGRPGIQPLEIQQDFTEMASQDIETSGSFKLSEQYFLLLRDYITPLHKLVKKLEADPTVYQWFNDARQESSKPKLVIPTYVLGDLIMVSSMVSKEKMTLDSLETFGISVLTYGLVFEANGQSNLSKCSFEMMSKLYNDGLLEETAIVVMDMADSMDITDADDNEIIVNKLILPAMLKTVGSPLLDEYATFIHRFGTIISKADSTVSTEEEKRLKAVYQQAHNPITEMENTNMLIPEVEDDETIDEDDETIDEDKDDETLKNVENEKTLESVKDGETLESVVADLNSLIGLEAVKSEINSLINYITIQKARETSGLKSSALSYHIVFTGNPGTGKTTVARIVAKIYKYLEILSKGNLVETDRSGLIAEYSGQTAVKVNKTVDSALNGVLFIDEAYALVGQNNDDFGKEAVATLIKRIEDDRDKLVVILAGYTNEMANFIDTNPGFKSRFNRYINFPDYTASELMAIFESQCKKLDYILSTEAKTKAIQLFENAYLTRNNSFGNGRYVRNIFEKTLEEQANRIAKEKVLTKELLTTIMDSDITEE